MARPLISSASFATMYRRASKRLEEFSKGLPRSPSADVIHDLRVNARRLQTMSKLLPGAIRRSPDSRKLDAALKSMMKATSIVRDLDTLMGTIESNGIPLPDRLLVSMRRRREVAMIRAETYVQVVSGIRVPRVRASRFSDKKLQRRLEERIEKRSLATRGSLKVVLQDESKVNELHALRLEVKKLRYLLELVDNEPPELSVLTGWQESLGKVHDLDVALGYLSERLKDASTEQRLAGLNQARHASFQEFVAHCRIDLTSMKESKILLPA